MLRVIRGVGYEVPDAYVLEAVARFDIWRDGKGVMTGKWAREAFLAITAKIASDIASKDEGTDPMAVWRLRKVLRSILASRPKAITKGA